MGELMGMGSTHWPAMIRPDDAGTWPFLRTLAHDPRVPQELQDPRNWPEGVRQEYGDDKGASAHREHRARLVNAFRKLKAEIDRFNPDFILMFGDDQYENFTEDIIPPFCVLAYDNLTSYPFRGRPGNVWNEPEDHPIKMRSKPDIGRWLARRFLEEGVDMSYAYKPLHWEGLGHAFVNIQMYLDYDRQGFDYPVVPMQVYSYGSRIIRNKRAMNGAGQEPDPPSPSPKRCFEVGSDHRSHPQRQSLSGRAVRLGRLVAWLSGREEPLSVAGHRSGSSAVSGTPGGSRDSLEGAASIRDRRGGSTRVDDVDLCSGSDARGGSERGSDRLPGNGWGVQLG